MKNPLVSIVTPVYQSEKFLEETLNSVLAQTFSDWEMILVDDGSTDLSYEIMKRYADKDSRFQIYKMKTPSGGPTEPRNLAIEKARGKYISFLDSDDLWLPEKLEKQIEFMKKNDTAFSITSYGKIDEAGNRLKRFIEVPWSVNYKQLLRYNYVGCLTAVYDSEKIGKVFMVQAPGREDYATWLKILRDISDVKGLNIILAYHRVRQNSFSSNKYKMLKDQFMVYYKNENMNIISSSVMLLIYVFQLLRLKLK